MKLPKSLGILLLGVWLILFGILTNPFVKIDFAYTSHLLSLLAIAVGVLLIWRRE